MKKEIDIVDLIIDAAHDIKAEKVEAYDVKDKSSIVDYHVVCSANTFVQINAIVKNVCNKLKDINYSYKVDGQRGNLWIVIDIGSVMVHVMSSEERERYKLDELWSVAKIVYH